MIVDRLHQAGRFALAAALACVVLAPLAGAHAYLSTSEPAAGAVVAPPVRSVTIGFSEGVEAAFSTFKLYRLEAEVDPWAENAEMRLAGLAAVVVSRYLGSQEDGDGAVAIEIVTDNSDRSVVTLRAAELLIPGHYVVMWRVLSADTHVVDGSFVFTVVAVE